METELVALWNGLKARFTGVPKRWFVLLALAGLVAFAVLFRILHLLNPDNYYIVSVDSYFFHWVSAQIMAGEPAPFAVGSGLSYALAYLARGASYVFGLSPVDALRLMSIIVPLFIGVISLILIHLASAKIWNHRVGLFAAFIWAIMFLTVFITSAGYIDRDGLSNLLLIIGAFLLVFSRDWRLHIGGRDMGWLATGLAILAIQGFLYVEWKLHGVVMIFGLVVLYFVIASVLEYVNSAGTRPSMGSRLRAALERSNWQTFAVIVLVNIVAFAFNADKLSSWFNTVTSSFYASRESGVAELGGIGFIDLLWFNFFLIPLALGIYVAWKRRSRSALFFASWFLFFLVLSLFTRRVLIYALPAACVLSGLGLAFLWEWQRRGKSQDWRRIGVGVLIGLLLLVSFVSVFAELSNPINVVNEEWHDALTYVREETPEDSVVMTNWSWGYWILDLGQRRPLVDNGYYFHTPDRDRDVALIYCATEPSEAVKIMKKNGADYLIFSKLDLAYDQTILSWAGLDEEYETFPEGCLVLCCLNGEFQSCGGLEVVYRSNPDAEVVILRLSPE